MEDYAAEPLEKGEDEEDREREMDRWTSTLYLIDKYGRMYMDDSDTDDY